MGDVTVRTEIAAAAEAIYDLVADMPGMGRWSPECERVEWTGGATGPAVGATFTGHNRNGRRSWSTHGTVTVAERGREFTFEVRSVLNLPVSRWSYRFDPGADGVCRVAESTEDRRGSLVKTLGRMVTGISDRGERNRETMTTTLERLRAAAESGAASGQSTAS
ncbi:MAG: SRPBCC family protein [Candidatus Dormibacteraeota bacterium]|nr:SRPBCC family protein [Candidatus Dormibacteraeota bacterium]